MSRAKAPILGTADDFIDVDRNVTVHLCARQANIYEKALRKIVARISFVGTDSERDIRNLAIRAIERAERLR